ncbi:MAG: recombinase family protein, partial [Deltaproteobacteria bacterium]
MTRTTSRADGRENGRHKPPAAVRCAIYTRKSTDEGLDQEFNSLDAQRESGEHYVRAQEGQGWVCLPTRYDDGGFTGGNMERPALKRLLADIEAGQIDCVVVYKVDRLSRSLLDFARIMETFDKHAVSFVSVTQQFNTSTSMGRLMLNVLLSFAQFEREIISERTRDKMAAARRKGKYVGGAPLLGYDIDRDASRLVVNEQEAVRVQQIFELYLEFQSLLPTIAELDRRGWTTKRWTTKKGTQRGGRPFNKNTLYGLLTNVAYVGKVRYKHEVYEGEHEGIVDPDTFEEVQRLLRTNHRTGGARVRNRFGALLKGLLRCAPCGCS